MGKYLGLAANNTNNTQSTGDNRWKADAFVNLHIGFERADGSTSEPKLGAISLQMSREIESQIMQMFREDPDNAADRLKNALIVKYNEVGQSEGGKLKL